MPLRRPSFFVFVFCGLLCLPLFGQGQSSAKPKPQVVVIGVNGMELDVIRPLLLEGKMPNLSTLIKKGAYGKLRTVSAPNCPRVYSTLFTSTKPEEHGVTGFIVGGITANTNMLKEEPIWSVLSKNGVSVGMANVPATFPVMPVNGIGFTRTRNDRASGEAVHCTVTWFEATVTLVTCGSASCEDASTENCALNT